MGLDLTNANEIGGDDPEFLRELMQVYIKRFSEYYDTLEEAIVAENLQEMSSRLHRVKSAASVLGYKTFCEQLKEAEYYCLSPEAKSEKAIQMSKDMLDRFSQTLDEVKEALAKSIGE